jgi:hypothetical protein
MIIIWSASTLNNIVYGNHYFYDEMSEYFHTLSNNHWSKLL